MTAKLSPSEVAERTGTSTAELDHFAAEGLIEASGGFRASVVTRVKLIKRLLAERMSPTAVRATLACLDDAGIARALQARENAPPPPRTKVSKAYRPR